eukprot:6824979-Pyramimonas_sp.AAC.1
MAVSLLLSEVLVSGSLKQNRKHRCVNVGAGLTRSTLRSIIVKARFSQPPFMRAYADQSVRAFANCYDASIGQSSLYCRRDRVVSETRPAAVRMETHASMGCYHPAKFATLSQ